jgi:hypothetical protein
MAGKTELIQIVVTPEQKKKIVQEAKKHDQGLSDYIRDSLSSWASFDVHFLEQVNMTAEKMHLPLTLAIQNLLQAYMATESAVLETYGTPPKTFRRAFQFDQDGLITGNKLSEMVFQQAKKDAAAVKERLEESVREKKAVRITTAEGAFIASHVAAAAV